MNNTPRAAIVEMETSHVMQNAVLSAVQLGNFPLQACDVQCAFESWAEGLINRPLHRKHAAYYSDLESRVRLNLVLLGFNF